VAKRIGSRLLRGLQPYGGRLGWKLFQDKLVKDGIEKLWLIHVYASNGREHAIELLLDKGVNLNAKGENDERVLEIAARMGREDIVKLLLG
jgi:hypothetical protein